MRKFPFGKLMILMGALYMLPASMSGQSVWERPDDKQERKENISKSKEVPREDAKYLEGAVSEVDGKVTWMLDYDLPKVNARQLYEAMLDFLTDYSGRENLLEGSGVSLVNKQDCKIVASFREWLIFSSNAFSLDRCRLSYALFVDCTDSHVHVEMSRITYLYDMQHRTAISHKAEEWITDKYSLNKKKTRLYPQSGKFRRKTIDRKDEIFSTIQNYLESLDYSSTQN